jgi:hypothetical protein
MISYITVIATCCEHLPYYYDQFGTCWCYFKNPNYFSWKFILDGKYLIRGVAEKIFRDWQVEKISDDGSFFTFDPL